MFKEVIISTIIVISIILLEVVTQNYTKETVNETTIQLRNLKEQIKNEEGDIASNIKGIFQNWEKRRAKLAYFIEHNELEKVETNLTNIRTFIEVDDLDMAISSIDEAQFILEHIKEKNSFNLENIF